MKHDELFNFIDALIREEITSDQHHRLQEVLKNDESARQVFRERMDLEAALRTWAAETPEQVISTTSSTRHAEPKAKRWGYPIRLAAIVTIILLVALPLVWSWFNQPNNKQIAEPTPPNDPQQSQISVASLGLVRQESDTEWSTDSGGKTGRLQAGRYSLQQGVAGMRFDSGTDIVMEAPCEIEVLSSESARLLSGNVFVNVTELSNGFVLETPEARIIDEGTEYAVALDQDSTEVHVFDGSVIWVSAHKNADQEERIEAGQARAYQRSAPQVSKHIPFGQRQFVRQLEAEIQEQAGDALLAYDGFENLAGRLRRGRSGFGWSNGWQSGRRGRGKLGEIIPAPNDVSFGINRANRRLLLLNGGDLSREFAQPLPSQPGDVVYVSLLIERIPENRERPKFLRISLESVRTKQKFRRPSAVSFGFSPPGFPYINNEGAISETAARIPDNEVVFCVFKLSANEQGIKAALRVYQSGEAISEQEPDSWTVLGETVPGFREYQSLRIVGGASATWHLDELKIGKTWQSVTRFNEHFSPQ